MIATFIFARECNLLSLGPQGIALFVLIYQLTLSFVALWANMLL